MLPDRPQDRKSYPHIGICVHCGIAFLISGRHGGKNTFCPRGFFNGGKGKSFLSYDLFPRRFKIVDIRIFIQHRVHSVSEGVELYLVMRQRLKNIFPAPVQKLFG